MPWAVGVSVVTCVMIRVVEGCAEGAVDVVVWVWVVLAGRVLDACCDVVCCCEVEGVVEVDVLGVDDCGVEVDAAAEALELLIFATAMQ